MASVSLARLIAVALLLHGWPASAARLEENLAAAIERAHRMAPEAISARGHVALAEAAVAGAAVPFVDNPAIEAGAGPRLTAERPIDVDVRIEQNLEPWRRAPRRAIARAGVVQANAEADAALRVLDLEVTNAFYEAVHAERLAELARRAEELARKAVDTAERRRKAGDITDLDVDLAKTAFGRARSATHGGIAERAVAIGKLAVLIGAAPDDTISLRGDLRPPPLPEEARLRTSLASRPDIRVLDAERAVASAERDRARASGRPGLALWAGYRREDTDSIVAGGLRFTLPIWNRARGERAAAAASERRAIDTRDAVARAAHRQLGDALAAYTAARTAVETFERDVVPVLDDSEHLLEKTIEAGQLAVNAYLVARQELLDGRREYFERQLALARAAALVRFTAGGVP